MNLLICVSIIGLIHASSTPSTPNVTTASTKSNPVVAGSTIQPLPAVTESTNKQSSLTTAGKDGTHELSTTSLLSTTASSDKSKISDNSVALESGILGIIGTQNAVNLEVHAIADAPTSGPSATEESGKVAQKTSTNSDYTGVIDSTNVKPNSVATDNIDPVVTEKTKDAITTNVQDLNGSNLVETVETPKEIKISLKETKVTDPSVTGSSDNIVNPAVNSVSDKKDTGADTPSELMAKDQSLNDVKVKDQSITVKTGSDGNNMGTVNIGPETVKGNVPEGTPEDNKIIKTADKVLVAGEINLDIIKAEKKKNCNVKNSTCVPTREELVAAGVENVDFMQHRIDPKPPTFNLHEPFSGNTAEANTNKAGEPKKCNVKNGKCVPTREELVAAGVENVDFMQHRIDPKPPTFNLNEPSSGNTAEANANKVGEPKKCNVKNSTCVPTREELVAAGVENVDFMQHRIDPKPPTFNLNEPSSGNTAEANANKVGEPKKCNVKNSTCVPTREELVAAGVENVDFMQHRIDPKPPTFNLNEPSSGNTAEANANKAGEPKKCNVKNSTCVPTREELVAAGVENVDFMQHRIDPKPPKLNLNQPSGGNIAETSANKAGTKKDCNVKNSKCVPTREELVAAGVENVDFMQHRVDPQPPQFFLNEPSVNNAAEANANKAGEPKKCNVKNSTCVPTREELAAAGVENVDFMQHRIDPKPPKFNLNEPSSSNTADASAIKTGPGCNVKNSTCVPSEKELIASGADMSVPRQYSIDTENVFLSQFKQSESKTAEGNTAVASNAAVSTSTTSGSEKTDKKTGNAGSFNKSSGEITQAMQSTTVQQIPKPSQTTQQTKSAAEQTTKKTTEIQTCPNKNCPETCVYGRKVNSKGCETCKCKFSNNCPRVTPASRLLCLLRARTSQSCTSNKDCRRNRICCPGTCGPICRRTPRSRSMLLSMLAD